MKASSFSVFSSLASCISNTPRLGFFITFEGGDGSGKSTQIKHLGHHLHQAHYKTLVTREPGGTPGAELLRNFLLSRKPNKLSPCHELLLFSAARLDHIEQLIRPAIQAGYIILCDRFLDSSRVYQGMDASCDPALIHAIERICVQEMIPDVTFLLDIPEEESLKRIRNRQKGRENGLDPFEGRSYEIYQRRRKAFLDIAHQEPKRFHVIDGMQSEDEIKNQIARIVFMLLQQHFHDRSKTPERQGGI